MTGENLIEEIARVGPGGDANLLCGGETLAKITLSNRARIIEQNWE